MVRDWVSGGVLSDWAVPPTVPDPGGAGERAGTEPPAPEGEIGAPGYSGEESAPRGGGPRQSIDRLESLTAAEYWPYPTYADILFSV